jgi:polygalacturonase
MKNFETFSSVRIDVRRFLLIFFTITLVTGRASDATFDIRAQGAKGDAQTLDTAAINKAIELASPAHGQVHIPPGRYLSGTIRLRNNITIYLEPGATIIGTTNLSEYTPPHPPENMIEARWGKWHRALFIAEDLENVTICGPGTIDGNKVFDPTGEEKMRGPHTFNFVNCRKMQFRDFTIVDSANYAIYFMNSDDVEFRNLKIIGGWDGIHWRGAADRWCHNVDIINCQIYTGDDAIAGRYWENTVISGCHLNSSCNGVRLIGPAKNLTIADNLFIGPGRQPHRSSRDSRRTNMLSGIILQPGAWDRTQGPLEDVFVTQNTMKNVASPITLWTKPGNTVSKVTIDGLKATGVYRSAISVESWADESISDVKIKNVSVEFNGGGTAEQAKMQVRGPGVDARPLPAWGIYARNVKSLTLSDIQFDLAKPDERPVVFADNVETLTLERFHFPGTPNPIATTNVANLKWDKAK